MRRSGAFPLAMGSRDAALLLDLPPGNYTALVSSRDGGTGVALVETYLIDEDLNPAARLLNSSCRGYVGTGDGILIPGIISRGTSTRRFLVRAVGPGIAVAPYNVAGVLVDPVLYVHRAGVDTSLAENDNWDADGAGPELAGLAQILGAFALPVGSKDAALIVSVPPDTPHTLHVRGKNGGTGIVLAEIYEIP